MFALDHVQAGRDIQLVFQSAPQSPAALDGIVVGAVPQQPNHYLRREQLATLRRNLTEDRVAVVVTGMRGVGKSQLAAAYAREAIDSGAGLVGWIDAETDGNLLEGLAAVARRLGVADPEGDSQRSAHRLRDYLASRPEPALLVFDNATAPDRVREFVPVRGGTRVVITSTDHAFTTLGSPIDLEVYARAQSLAFLRAATGLDDDSGADRIAGQLGDLPLALTQAAATITIRRLDYGSYEQLLDQPLPAALTRLAGSDHPHRVDKAILLSLDTTEASSADPALDTTVRDVLELIAMLSPAGVRTEILPDASGRLTEALARCEWGSLLTRSTTGETVVMHRLISRVIRERAVDRAPEPRAGLLSRVRRGEAGTGLTRLTNTALDVIESHYIDVKDAWHRREAGAHLIDHIDALWGTRTPATGTAPTLRLIQARHWAGRQLIESADVSRAVEYTYQALADTALVLGTDHLETLAARNALAHAYHAAGRVDEAVAVLELCRTDAERILKSWNPGVLAVRENLADAYRAAGRLDEAIALYRSILPKTKWIPNSIMALDRNARAGLAAALRAAGRITEAIPLYEELHVTTERTLGPAHPTTLACRNNLAIAYQSAGRRAEAITLLEQTQATSEELLGPDHPDTLNARNNVAYAYRAAGRLADAIGLYERTLADRRRSLGPLHPDTLASSNNLAAGYLAAGRVDEAVGLYEQTLTDRERVLSTDHPSTLLTRGNVALAYQKAGRMTEAIATFERTIADSDRLLGHDHPHTLTAYNNLAVAYQAAGRAAEAVTIFEQVLPAREHQLGVEHPDALMTRGNLASAYSAVGRSDEALRLNEHTLTIRERVLGPEHPDTLLSRNNLAASYLSAGRWAEATALLEQTLTARVRILGADHPDTSTTRDDLAFAYRQAGRYVDAVALRELFDRSATGDDPERP
ncbi:tetratricopeptide repeat protein [Nocardia sp. NPDC024068]|uniref:tetratricopeptide repeat protein n=1 Tax=Nocardia sp. NPDC024068 TaxID=3157197 RepID=UPI0034002F81